MCRLKGTLLNLLLRNFLAFNLVDQADKLVEMTKRTTEHEHALDQSAVIAGSLTSHGTFDEATASSNQHARYLYYTGRIQAIKLSYTQSYESLIQSLRKAPQNSALGFRRTVCTIHPSINLHEAPLRYALDTNHYNDSFSWLLVLSLLSYTHTGTQAGLHRQAIDG